jgi:hypothetical protein
LRAEAGVAPGAPVVCGDVFVGRVVERASGASRARVQLVTEASFRVGAQVHTSASEPEAGAGATAGGEPVYLTVGGLRTSRRRGEPRVVRLAVHQPSSDALAGGLARVHELFADAEDFAALAEGFRLGTVRREGERGAFWIEPELDYLDGLLLLAIVVPAAETGPTAPPAPSALAQADGRWVATRALTFGDPSPWRSTIKIPLGRRAGVRAGSAVTGPGARLVGRVARAASHTADVALLTDAGFTCVAIAEVEGEREPRILGRITTLGRGADGTIRLRWSVRQPLASTSTGAALRARIFTGSGEPGLPGGLVLGSALLPPSAEAGEERELALDPGVEPLDVRALFVRCEAEDARP